MASHATPKGSYRGNVFDGEYKEPPSYHILGCWSDEEFRTLNTDIHGIIGAVRRGVMSEKKFLCKDERHPLWNSYAEGLEIGKQQIQRQLSDDRIHADLLHFLDENFGTDDLRTQKEKVCLQFFQSLGKRLESIRGKAQVLLVEALKNIVEHGMQHDPRKVGLINIGMNEKGQFGIVAFTERGFDHQKAIDAALEEINRERTSGRGLLLMRRYPNLAKFSESGRYLIMQFNIRELLQEVLSVEVQKLGLNVDRKHGELSGTLPDLTPEMTQGMR